MRRPGEGGGGRSEDEQDKGKRTERILRHDDLL
jgi:hypothetical protein